MALCATKTIELTICKRRKVQANFNEGEITRLRIYCHDMGSEDLKDHILKHNDTARQTRGIGDRSVVGT